MIVLREAAGEIEVLMTHRHADLAFMGDMWVFPGGALAPADRSDAARALTCGRCAFELYDLEGARVPEPLCTAFAIAACRETFEETGILLARKMDGSAPDATQLARLRAERAQLAKDPAQFSAALAREGLRLDVDCIVYWTHWITPSGVSRRFDTRFFVTPAPDTHELLADTYETTECVWMSPRALLEGARRDSMKLALPTRYTLEDLRASIDAHGTLAALLSREARRDVAPIMPKLIEDNGTSTIVMPWDPQYANVPGEGVQPGRRYPPALVALPSRAPRDH